MHMHYAGLQILVS